MAQKEYKPETAPVEKAMADQKALEEKELESLAGTIFAALLAQQRDQNEVSYSALTQKAYEAARGFMANRPKPLALDRIPPMKR